MPDLDADWGGDLALTPDGDLALADGIRLDNQRIVRRLLTALHGYVWHGSYGGGLLQRVGKVELERRIKALVQSQIQLETSVARIPPPTISVAFQPGSNGVCVIEIDYTDALSGTARKIAFEFPTDQ